MNATRRIQVALDETESSRRVAEFVNSFFSDDRFEVLAVNVASAPIAWYPGDMMWGIAAPYAFPMVPPPQHESYEQAREHGREAIAASNWCVRQIGPFSWCIDPRTDACVHQKKA